ncbi:Protein dopey-2 [Oryzias melastigma]|uniref:Protein dopey-2 n=1 Tax=Oryzias melastigma TaxID=30732 RepID=A0A834BKH1_ORYME|nr:Protein dopey-2 [Oryzias melastigma]
MLLYPAAGGWRHLLQGLSLLDSLFRSSAECPLVEALSSTSLDTSSAAHLNLVSNLLQRHQQAQSFYGGLLSPSPFPSAPPSLVLLEVQVKSVTVLTRIVNQLCCTAREKEGSNLESIRKILSGCKLQQYALLSLSASMYASQKGTDKESCKNTEEELGGPSEESLVNLGAVRGQEQYPLQIELLKLLHALIVLEYHVWPGGVVSAGQAVEPCEASTLSTPLAREWQTAVLFQQSIKAAQYVHSHPITAQGMFVSAAARALQPQYGYAMHPHWVSLLCSSLPYLGRLLGIIVTPFISQVCRNLDDLVKLHEHDGGKTNQSFSGKRENIAPDYPLTLLEGLTTITHYCLLDNKKSLVSSNAVDVRNARNAVIEALLSMLSSMALLWGVVTREEVLPVASEPRMTIVELVKSLHTMQTETILHLVKEVVKKPHQIKGDQKSTLVDIPMLQFSYAYIQSIPAQALQENVAALLSLVRDSVKLNLAPPGHFLLLGFVLIPVFVLLNFIASSLY